MTVEYPVYNERKTEICKKKTTRVGWNALHDSTVAIFTPTVRRFRSEFHLKHHTAHHQTKISNLTKKCK